MPKTKLAPSMIAPLLLVIPLLTAASPKEDGYAVRVHAMDLLGGDEADVYAPALPHRQARKRTDAFPLLAFLQGALVDKSYYSTLGRRLAAQGFIVVIPNHFRAITAPPIAGFLPEVNQVTDILDSMKLADEDPSSAVYRVVDTARLAVVGHSLGGGVGLYAAGSFCDPLSCSTSEYAPPPELKAVVAYGANTVSQLSGDLLDLDTSGVAVALLQGTLDGIADPDEADRTLLTLESPHALVEIAGASHFSLCDVADPPGILTPDPSPATLDQDEAIAQIARWIGAWLEVSLASAGAALPTH